MTDINLLEHQPIAWTPTPDVIERAQLTKFMRQVGVSTWDELYQFSIRDVEKFTEEVLKFLDIKFDPPYSKLLDTSGGIEFPRWFTSEPPASAGGQFAGENSTNWPPAHAGGSDYTGLNVTTMCLDRWQTDEMKDQPAVIWEGEEGGTRALTYGSLFEAVQICSALLRESGISKGDAVGIHLPMMLETVVALLAINRLGAIAVPVFSGYGIDAIASRMNAVSAKAIFTCEEFPRRGKDFEAIEVAKVAINMVPSIDTVIIVGRSSGMLPFSKGFEICGTAMLSMAEDRDHRYRNILFKDRKVILWSYHVNGFLFNNPPIPPILAEPTSAEDPLIILYTSGTTGKPKGIAHTHASFPIKAAQDMAFGMDVGRGTRICWYTDLGWMMGPWLIYGALINGATICLYDGAPDYPTPDRMWEFCARHKVEFLGISPTLVRSLAAHDQTSGDAKSSPPYEAGAPAAASASGVDVGGVAAASDDGVVLSPPDQNATLSAQDSENHPPAKAVPLLRKEGSSYRPPHQRHDLSHLRAFGSTGEPWNPGPWWWLFKEVGNSKLPIINYSGGTEISGGILCGNPLLPIKPCSFPAPCPGMDVDIVDEYGESVKAGQVGELVIKQPWIGMARGFWQEKERYLETYWSRFKDIWVHGDWAMRDEDGHWFILGRSDDTLKVAGKRVGPAEVESILVSHPAITEAAVIGVPDEAKGTAMVAFCVLGVQSESSPPYEGGVDAASADGVVLSIELKSLVARDMGKPLAPSKIYFVSALPKTRNAKVMRRVLRAAYLGEDAGDLSSLENPKTVKEISRLR